MKKIVLATVVAGLMSTGAMADSYVTDATVNYVASRDNGVAIGIKKGSVQFERSVPSARAKEIIALALTALSTGQSVNFVLNNGAIKNIVIKGSN